ncbi:MAG: hypothetical protein NTW05_12325, partial [Pseudonocardiales bacterium]|nr:hypothetical protein [Pseudonocardiales bacterium]
MTPSDQSGGRGVRGMLNDLLHGRDDEQRRDDAHPDEGDRAHGDDRHGDDRHGAGSHGAEPRRDDLDGAGTGTDREPGRYGAAHPAGPHDEQPTDLTPRPDADDSRRPRPAPAEAGAHRLAEPGDELFGSRDGDSGRSPTFGPRPGA